MNLVSVNTKFAHVQLTLAQAHSYSHHRVAYNQEVVIVFVCFHFTKLSPSTKPRVPIPPLTITKGVDVGAD